MFLFEDAFRFPKCPQDDPRSHPVEEGSLSKSITKAQFTPTGLIPGSQDEAKMTQDEAKMVQDDPKWCQDEINMAQDGVKKGNESKRERQKREGTRAREEDNKEQKNHYI